MENSWVSGVSGPRERERKWARESGARESGARESGWGKWGERVG